MNQAITRRDVLRALPVLAAGIGAASCGYALAGRGSFLPDYIKTLGIPMFGNATPYQAVEQVFTQKVRLEFHQFPLSIHAPGAELAAQASLCANDQGGFWPYHNRLFPAQDQGQPGFTIDALVRYADELGLDSRALMDCMSSQTYRDAVTASGNEALSLGLNATPSILVNGVRMTNPFDYEGEVKTAIENALAEAGS